MNPLRLLDRAWLMMEGKETPMHVGLLLILSPPPDAERDYVEQLVAAVRSQSRMAAPWNLILPAQKLRSLAPFWISEPFVGSKHHVFLHTLGETGDRAALTEWVAEEHAKALDPQRPLWEFHLVQGLDDGRFALYAKVHHALLDGVGGLRLLDRLFTPEPQGYWDARRRLRKARRSTRLNRRRGSWSALRERGQQNLQTTLRYLQGLVRREEKPDAHAAPACVLNDRPVTARRSFAAFSCERSRIKSVARLAGVTDNDVLLAVFSGAVAAFLKAQGDLPGESLIAAVPVSTRTRQDAGVGTALSFGLAELGTESAHPLDRLRRIAYSMARAKRQLAEVPPGGMLAYTAFLMAPFVRQQLLGRKPARHPLFNLVISNVPGPRSTRYLGRARLDEAYPLSVLFHGQALNITCVRYADALDVGFTACPDVLSGLQKLPLLAEQALCELEECVLDGKNTASRAVA